ncbi:MAG: hypothetical protein IPH04_01310 [Saprospirales bacterium]|nr:hypothetical protein [Saprospirales bacterium]
MHKILLIIGICVISTQIDAQISEIEFSDTYDRLLENLTAENWPIAASLTDFLLVEIEKTDSMDQEKKVLRYLSVYTTAGLLNENLVTRKQALRIANKFKGMDMVMPAHLFRKDCYDNCTYVDSERDNTLFTGVNNAAGTQIFSLEWVKMKDPVTKSAIKEIEGKYVSLRGKLIKVIVTGNLLPRFHLEFENGEIEDLFELGSENNEIENFIEPQAITYDDFRSLIPYLKTEDWESVFNQSSKLLRFADNDTSELKAIVLYINIFSAAGMVTEGQMTYEELELKVMKFQGAKIIMAGHPVSKMKGNTIRQTYFSSTATTNEAFTTATNLKETSILCFEKFYFNEKINPDDFKDSFVRCGGTLEKIETNPNKSPTWVLRSDH